MLKIFKKLGSEYLLGIFILLALCTAFSNLSFARSPVTKEEQGRIIAERAGCVACHTPGLEKGIDKKDLLLSGRAVASWYAPNITPDPISGLGAWSQEEILQFLKTGRVTAKAQAGGSMATTIESTLHFMKKEDLDSLLVFLQSVPPLRDSADKNPEAKAAFAYGAPLSSEPEIRGIYPQDSNKSLVSGMHLYSGNCASCHGSDGSGSENQRYPSLYNNTVTGRANSNLVAAILYGMDREVAGDVAFMPGFGSRSYLSPLTDKDIADIANYIYLSFGNPVAATVRAEDVAKIRARKK